MKRPPGAMRVMAHPAAYRIAAAVGIRGPLTTADIAGILSDIPSSSLYRQLQRLRDAGILRVVAERQARGAIERTYALASRDAGAFTPADLAELPIGQLRATLRNFLGAMFADASAYVESRALAKNRSDLRAGLIVANLTDEEYARAVREAVAAISSTKTQPSGPAPKRRHFYLVALPDLAGR